MFTYNIISSFLSRNVRKRTFVHVRPAKIQISLRLRRIFPRRILDSHGRKVTWCGQMTTLIRLREYTGGFESLLGVHVRRYHYENTPIQIYWNFHLQKQKVFRQKNLIFFHISAQNIDCGYSLEPPVLSRNKKNNVYPCKPQFFLYKSGVQGGQNYIGMFSWCGIWHYSSFVRTPRLASKWPNSHKFTITSYIYSSVLSFDCFLSSMTSITLWYVIINPWTLFMSLITTAIDGGASHVCWKLPLNKISKHCLDWLQSPMTKYFILIIMFDNAL